jgi:hypothetical protein
MPPVTCSPCRVRFEGSRYHVEANGTVRPILMAEAAADGATIYTYGAPLASADALRVRREAARLRRNRNARERSAARRSIGMVRCRDGSWE